MNTQTTYEFPLNERMRVFMRLEQLFIQLKYYLDAPNILDKRTLMSVLFEISMIFSRNNTKSELLKEIDRITKVLSKIADNPDVDSSKLEEMLTELTDIRKVLHDKKGKVGEELIKSHLFQSFSQRHSIPGGSCSFDLPSFHYWLSQDEAAQQKELQQWTQSFLDIYAAIELILNLIRQSSVVKQEIAKASFFQLTLNSNEAYQILRVQVPQTLACFAEISGGRHRFTVRFMTPAKGIERSSQATADIPFALTCCHL